MSYSKVRLSEFLLLLALAIMSSAYEGDENNDENALVDDETDWESTRSGMAKEEVVTSATMIDELTLPTLEYRYASFGQPDPFLPTLDAPTPKEKQFAGFEIPVVSPLQVPLGYLKIKGIWLLSSGQRRALVTIRPEYFSDFVGHSGRDLTEDQGREGYIARVGDPIGPAGKIVSITKDSIVSRQYRILEDGTREFDDKVLSLRTTVEQEVSRSDRSYILRPGGGVRLRAKSQSVEFNKQFGGNEAEIDVSARSEFEPASPTIQKPETDVTEFQGGEK